MRILSKMNALGYINFSIFCIILFFEFSVGRSNVGLRPEESLNDSQETIDYQNTKLKSALKHGEMEKARKIISNNTLEKYLTGYDKKTKGLLLQNVYAKTRITEILLKTGIVVIDNKGNGLKKWSPNELSFKVVLVPGTDLVIELQINLTAVRNWGNSTVQDGRKPLHIICSLPDVLPEIVNTILVNGQDDVNVKSDINLTPLMFATSTGNLDVVKFLVEKGANINELAFVKDVNILESAHQRYMKLFTKTKLDQIETFMNFTALDVAAWGDYLDIVLYLLSRGVKINDKHQSWVTLTVPVANGHIKIVETLLKKGIDVHGKDLLGSTTLHRAAEGGGPAMVELLLKYGADVNATDYYGWTPLHVAALHSLEFRQQTIQLLLDSGANVEALTDGGYSILSLVVAGSNMDFLNYLLEKFDTLNSTSGHEDLGRNISNGECAELISYLLQKGAPLNAKDNVLGWSPLHWAAASGDLKAAKLLAKHGAGTSTKSYMGLNPFETAKYFGRKRVADFLRALRIQ